MPENKICPLCEEGKLHVHTEQVSVEYHESTEECASVYSVCDVCGAEQMDADQSRFNKRAVIALRKKIDGLLTGSEVRQEREDLGITQAQAAKIFGGGPVAFSKYESDDVMQSEAMDKLLRLAKSVPAAFAELVREAGITLPTSGYSGLVDWQQVDVVVTREPPKLRIVANYPNFDNELEKGYA